MENMQHQNWHRRRGNDWRDRRNSGKIVFGWIIAGVGILVLLKMFHLLPPIVYSIHFGWPLVLIVVGAIIGVKSGFRNNTWWILMLIGGLYMLPPLYIGDVPARRILWPALLIGLGLSMVFRRRSPRLPAPMPPEETPRLVTLDADIVNIDVVFGGRKEIITSRAFRGGMVRATFAGAEINMAAAEAGVHPMVLEIHAAFAGVELIVPSHWEIQNEINPTMGSVEDQRMIRTHDTTGEKRTLVLRGSCSFGSVEIKSY